MSFLNKVKEVTIEEVRGMPTMMVDWTKTTITDGDSMVWFVCPNCGVGRWIRQALAKPRYKKSSLCRACSWIAQIKWAEPGEFDSNPDIVVDYKKQKVATAGTRSNRVVYVWSTCPECKEERWLLLNWLRNQGRTSLCMPCSRKRVGFLGERSPHWKGGISINHQGYRCIHERLLPQEHLALIKQHLKNHRGYYYEHRVIALITYGPKAVAARMVIRHLDGDKLNNHPSNLAYGPQSSNIRDHVEDRHELKKWRRIAERLAKENALLKQMQLKV